MYRKNSFLAAILCAITCLPSVWANNVFVLPNGTNSRIVNVFDGDTLGALGTFSGPDGLPLATVASPDSPVTYWTYGSATSDALVGVDQGLFDVARFSSGVPATAGVVTPNGLRFLLVADRLRIFDTTTNAEVVPFSALNVGVNPIDVAASPDSRYAYVLSSDSHRLTRVDLNTSTVAGTVTVPGTLYGVTVGVDGTVYVSGINQITVINGMTMTQVGAIALNGQPGKVYITPDNMTGVAVNRNVITGTALWVFDLTNLAVRAQIPTLSVGITPIVLEDKVLVASSDRAFLTSDTNNILYELVLNPAVNILAYSVGGVGSPSGVIAADLSQEFPNARYLYYATATTLTRVDLDTDGLSGPPAAIGGNVNRLSYARQPSTNAITNVYKLNDSQQIPEGGEVAFKPVIIRAVDAADRPVFNANITWSTTVEGVTIENAMTKTNLDGIASAYVNPGEYTGQITVHVLVGSLAGSFTLRVGSGGGGGGGGEEPTAGIFIVEGNGQLIPQQQAISFVGIRPKVVVRGLEGEPLVGATVTWTLQGAGTISPPSNTTDENGEASVSFQSSTVTPGQSFNSSKIIASSGGSSVEFWVTTYPSQDLVGNLVPPPQVQLYPDGITNTSGKIGDVIGAALRLRVTAAAGSFIGQPIPHVSLAARTADASTTTARCQGQPVLTDANGEAQCDMILGGSVGTAPLVVNVGGLFRIFTNRTVTAEVGDPGVATIISGNLQSGGPNAILSVPLVVAITDTAGNKLPGVPVKWQVTIPGTVALSNVVSTTDANGLVTANATLGTVPGPQEVTVTAGAATTTFTLTVNLAITALTAVSGGGQTAFLNEQFASPLVVRLNAENGDPVPGQTISFTVESGSAVLGTSTATTGANGQASVLVSAGGAPGPIVIAARFGSLQPALFNLTARAPGPLVTSASFRNGASEAVGVVPGSVIKIIGMGIAANVAGCVSGPTFGPLPLELAGVSVQFGPDAVAKFSPIFYVCNSNGEESVIIQAPFDLTPGVTQATIRAGGGSTTVTDVQVLSVQPGIFETQLPSGPRIGVVLRPDGSYVSPTNPAKQGEIVALIATGLGAVLPPAATNATGVPGQKVVATVVVGVNNQGVRVDRAEYLVGARGLYAVYFEIPRDPSFVGPSLPLALAIQQGNTLLFGNGSSIAVQP